MVWYITEAYTKLKYSNRTYTVVLMNVRKNFAVTESEKQNIIKLTIAKFTVFVCTSQTIISVKISVLRTV